MPDVQTAWLLLLYCAVPRANHLIRAVPPALVANYASAHDDGMWQTFLDIIGYQEESHTDQLQLDSANNEIETGNVSIGAKGQGKGNAATFEEASAENGIAERGEGGAEGWRSRVIDRRVS